MPCPHPSRKDNLFALHFPQRAACNNWQAMQVAILKGNQKRDILRERYLKISLVQNKLEGNILMISSGNEASKNKWLHCNETHAESVRAFDLILLYDRFPPLSYSSVSSICVYSGCKTYLLARILNRQF